jgi:hypothetical protein
MARFARLLQVGAAAGVVALLLLQVPAPQVASAATASAPAPDGHSVLDRLRGSAPVPRLRESASTMILPTDRTPLLTPGLRGPASAASHPIVPVPHGVGPRTPPIPSHSNVPASTLTRATDPIHPGTAPPEVVLTGNAFLIVNTSETVGNITLSGNGTLYLHNDSGPVTLTVLGEITLSGNALLFLNQSTMAIGESYDVEWNIQMTGQSRFVAVGSNLTTNGYQWGALFEGMANVTVFNSSFCYPYGWIDTDLVDGATLDLLFSGYSSDVILFDVPYLPSRTNFSAAYSAGFNVWLNFGQGSQANLTLPGALAWENWSFPGTEPVSGLSYSVTLFDSFVLLFAILLGQGSNLTVANSPDVVLSFDSAVGTLNLTGLREAHYGEFQFDQDQFALHLTNATVFTWNVYGLGGNASISDSQVGEIQVYSGAWATVHDSNLTGHGGYYGDQSTSTLAIYDSSIHAEVVGYTGTTRLENCTVDTPGPSWVLATGSSVVVGLDTTLASQDPYEVQASGTVEIGWSTHLNVTDGGVPAPNASVLVRWASNGSTATGGTTNVSGEFDAELLDAVETVAGNRSWNYTAVASRQVDGGSLALPLVLAPRWLTLAMVPLIQGTSPSNGSVGVPTNLSALDLNFAFPMSPNVSASAFNLSPAEPWTVSWNAFDENLSIHLGAFLDPGTAYTWTLDTDAVTQGGIPLHASVTGGFTTQPLRVPAVYPTVRSTTPTNLTQSVSVWANVTMVFDEGMDVSSLLSALTVVPSTPAGTTTANTTAVFWSHDTPLEGNTTYTVTISVTAENLSQVPLQHPYALSFRTGANLSSGHPIGNSPPPGTSAQNSTAPGFPWFTVGLIGILGASVVLRGYVFYRRRKRRARNAPEHPPTAPPPPSPPPPSAPLASGGPPSSGPGSDPYTYRR